MLASVYSLNRTIEFCSEIKSECNNKILLRLAWLGKSARKKCSVNCISILPPFDLALAAEEDEKVPCSQKLRFYKGDWKNRTTNYSGEGRC